MPSADSRTRGRLSCNVKKTRQRSLANGTMKAEVGDICFVGT